ncbi:MAG: methyltransferase domain-containing protein [Deltaproteobacteria bacterium]|nr:methyltransferase domain-containing protein [Deltaproteobacteria bacterium]
MVTRKLQLDGAEYSLVLRERHPAPSGGEPVLCLVSYLPNRAATDIIRIAVESIRKYTTSPYSLWVVDNASPPEHLEWLRGQRDITLVENLTPPKEAGSYANAAALEICRRLIPPETARFMALHQDILACKAGWLEYLLSKFSEKIRAVGVREDKVRVPEGILHVLGYIIDFQLFKELKLDFYPRLPGYDAGDLAIHALRQAGYEYFAAPNTMWRPELAATLPEPYSGLGFDRALDDAGDVFFMHLGRGSLKTSPGFAQDEGKSLARWRAFARETLGITLPLEIAPRYDEPKPFIRTFRRWHLDAFLGALPWRGRVLDVGGRKGIYRGSFRPPFAQVESWEYVNINPATNPDYLASADDLPIASDSRDIVLLSEVLEHLRYPEKALAEAWRVLAPGGHVFLLAPFLYPLHADPEDYQRWLPSKYGVALGETGFEDVRIQPMGGFFAVVYDLFYAASNFSMKRPGRKAIFLRKLLPLANRLCLKLEKRYPDFSSFITTGYCVCARKRGTSPEKTDSGTCGK